MVVHHVAYKGSGCWFPAFICLPLLIISYLPLWSFFFFYFKYLFIFVALEKANPTCCLGHIWFMPLALGGQVMPNAFCFDFIFFPPLSCRDREQLIRVGVPSSYFWGRTFLGKQTGVRTVIWNAQIGLCGVVGWYDALIIHLNSKKKRFLLEVPFQLHRFVECTYFLESISHSFV